MRKQEQLDLAKDILAYLEEEKENLDYMYEEELSKEIDKIYRQIKFKVDHFKKSDATPEALGYIAGVEDENRRIKFIVNQLGLSKEMKGYI